MKKHLLRLFTVVMALTVLPSVAMADPIEIYLLKSTAYPTTYVYVWDTAEDVKWPGVAMSTTTIDDVEYYYWKDTENRSSINLIFNNNNNGKQTNDIKSVTATTFYKLVSNSASKTSVTTFNPFVLADPKISSERNTITIQASADGGTVYYTTDGTEPGKESAVYEGPFTLDNDATVKAIQMKEVAKSGVVSYDFTWNYYAEMTVAAGIYYVTDGEAVPEICSTDLPYLPVEGQPKINNQPDALYLMGNLIDADGINRHWQTNYAVAGKRYGGCYVFENVRLGGLSGTDKDNAYFNFCTKIGTTGNSSEWDNVVNTSNRYGANSKDAPLSVDNATGFKTFSGYDASSAQSWKIAAGTYDIIMDFKSGKITATNKPAPEFVAISVSDTEGMRATEGTLYKGEITGANTAIRCGETVVTGINANGEGSYIIKGEKAESIAPVCVGLFGVENGVIGADSRLVASFGTKAARYSEGDNTCEVTDGEAALSSADFAENGLVNLIWEADNEQNLTFTGHYSVVNATSDVKVRAKVPSSWTGIAYTLVSALDSELTESGEFSETEGDYLVITVPAAFIHSTITLSNTMIAPMSEGNASEEVSGADVENSYTYNLAGKSMYFDNNGQHWSESEMIPTGIDQVTVDNTSVEFFNIQGMKVTNPTKGIYIRRCGNKVSKVTLD